MLKSFSSSLVFIIILLSGCDKKSEIPVAEVCVAETSKKTSLNLKEIKKELQQLQDEFAYPCSVTCCELYIETVINEGSDVLKMPSGLMAEGYAIPEDAKKIASYVMTLSGREPTHPELLTEGNLYFNGNCGGCHGNDGKGLSGAYPDLTLKEFKGVKIHKKMRIETLKKMLKEK